MLSAVCYKKSSKHLKAKLYCTVPLELQAHGQLDGFSAGSVIPSGSGCVGVIFYNCRSVNDI